MSENNKIYLNCKNFYLELKKNEAIATIDTFLQNFWHNIKNLLINPIIIGLFFTGVILSLLRIPNNLFNIFIFFAQFIILLIAVNLYLENIWTTIKFLFIFIGELILTVSFISLISVSLINYFQLNNDINVQIIAIFFIFIYPFMFSYYMPVLLYKIKQCNITSLLEIFKEVSNIILFKVKAFIKNYLKINFLVFGIYGIFLLIFLMNVSIFMQLNILLTAYFLKMFLNILFASTFFISLANSITLKKYK